VSVFFNRAALVPSSVGSLLAQTLGDLEILVVDDGSSDSTADALAGLTDPRYRSLSGPNRGFTAAVNGAIAATTGKYVALHGSGDISLAHRLETQVNYLESNPDVGVVGCCWRAGNKVVGPSGRIERGPLAATVRRRNPFIHGEVMFRRDLFQRAGGYREIFRFAQDRDLWLRMGRECDYAVLPETLYERTFPADSISRTAEHLILQKRFSEFAVQNDGHFRRHGIDLVDRFGPGSMLLYRRSARVARNLVTDGLRFVLHRRPGADTRRRLIAFRLN
jgi:glycosyltransferase involved in cell wall biosynthesis